MIFNVKEDFKSVIKSDLHKKYLKSGMRISGEINDDKIILFIEDDYGKHSAFMSQYFYGKIFENTIIGKFRAPNYVIILLAVLFAFSLESLIAAVVLQGYSGIVLPAVIMVAEALYFIFLKRISSESNELIEKYLSEL